jgi:hypothetical protein
MRVRSGRAFKPQRRHTLPCHEKLTRELGTRYPFSFKPRARAATRLASAAKRAHIAVPLPAPLAEPPLLDPADLTELAEPLSERSEPERDSVLPLELLAHPSVPAPAESAAATPRPTTPKPPRPPQRIMLETEDDDDLSEVAPPPLFAVARSDAPLVASTAPPAPSSFAQALNRTATVVLVLGLGVAAGWTLRGGAPAPEHERTASAHRPATSPVLAAAPVDLSPTTPNAAPTVESPTTPTPTAITPPAPAASTQPDTPAAPKKLEENAANSAERAEAASDSALPAPSAQEPEPSELGEFDATAARESIALAEARAMACHTAGEPGGPAAVVIRFAPSGRVTTATVESGPFAGTPTGGCIAAKFRSARVPAFAGDHVTVKRTVLLR